MTRLLPILLLWCVTASGQVMLPHRHAVGSSPLFPPGTPYLWWVASDIADGAITSWPDRIQGWVLSSAQAYPQKCGRSVHFVNDGLVQISGHTLDWGDSSSSSWVYIMTPNPAYYNVQQCLWTFSGGSSAQYLNLTVTNALSVFDTGTVITNVYTGSDGTGIYDLVSLYISGGVNATWKGYLNGTVSWTNTTIGAATFIETFGARGAGTVPPATLGLQGNVYELLVYTNLSASDIPAMHSYASSKYTGTNDYWMCPPIQPLLLWYKFNEGSGTNLTDSSGNGASGWVKGGSWVTGKSGSGYAINLNGTSDYARSSNNLASSTNILTVCFWEKVTASDAGVHLHAVLGPDWSTNSASFFSYYSGTVSAKDGGIQYGANKREEYTGTISTNAWHHIAYIFDNSTTAGDVKIYIDGSQVSTTVSSNTKNANGNFKTDVLYFGGTDKLSYYFYGAVDDFRVYSGALTVNDILNLYSNPQ